MAKDKTAIYMMAMVGMVVLVAAVILMMNTSSEVETTLTGKAVDVEEVPDPAAEGGMQVFIPCYDWEISCGYECCNPDTHACDMAVKRCVIVE